MSCDLRKFRYGIRRYSHITQYLSISGVLYLIILIHIHLSSLSSRTDGGLLLWMMLRTLYWLLIKLSCLGSLFKRTVRRVFLWWIRRLYRSLVTLWMILESSGLR